MNKKKLIILVFIMFFCAKTVIAKSVQQTSQVTLKIPEIISLKIENGNVNESPSEEEIMQAFDQGRYEFTKRPKLIVQSNSAWEISVVVNDIVTPEGVTKTASDFLLKHDQEAYDLYGFYNIFKPLSGNDVIASGETRLRHIEFNIDYAMILNTEEDSPGEYRFTLTYTLSTPA